MTASLGFGRFSQWDIALRDLDYAIGLDENGNSEITWQEVLNKQNEIRAYAFSRLGIKNAQQTCPVQAQHLLIDDHTDGAYAVIQFHSLCNKKIETLNLEYHLFSDIDPSHRGLLNLSVNNTTKTSVLGPENAHQSFVLNNTSNFSEFKRYVVEGIWHIWKGFDHILFLISLLLPAVLVRKNNQWQASEYPNSALKDVLKVVTAFTVAHSITLSLATLQIVSLPSRFIESAIAASVIIAALNNLMPYLLKSRWKAAFAFGLIHGFGFAAVLTDLGLHGLTLILALLGFNLGVEFGQIAILSGYLLIAYNLRKTWCYQYVMFYGGSIITIAIASTWLMERAFNLTLISGVLK